MKTLSTSLFRYLVLLLVSVGPLGLLFAQTASDTKPEITRQMLESRDFVFRARTVLPMSGRAIQLTSEYDVQVSGDTIDSHLPYFGRAFALPYGGGRGGIQFTSTQFRYQLTPHRRGGWTISIVPADADDVRQMHFTVSESGFATLNVISNNRQAISYTGYLEPRSRRR